MQRWCKYKKHPLAEAFEVRANGQDVDKESGVMKRKTFAAVTSQQVAQLAGVSQSAVSRTFTPGASISPATREKVLKAARELGYRPNAIARSLNTARSRIIGVVISYFDNPFYSQVLEALAQKLDTLNYHLLLFVGDREGNVDRIFDQIMQYRVAENSEVINTLIAAAQNGKKVTVFVELKARFDEENNLATAEMMKRAGIHIIFSIPGLKVHAKVALVLRYNKEGKQTRSYAYISTGNFNEKTARIYADSGLFTSNEVIVNDLHTLFRVLRKEVTEPRFKRLLVARFNLLPELRRRIGYEINMAKAGKEARIVLKMNALQDPAMIDELYKASEAGVKIDLIVRGICCLIPNQPYSRNIRITRIVDSFLEHARVWYFHNGGKPLLFMGSPDWMRRNLYRRIEAVTPVLDEDLKQQLIDMLAIQLKDNRKAGWVDEHLNNVPKRDPEEGPVRAQYAFYEYLEEKNKEGYVKTPKQP